MSQACGHSRGLGFVRAGTAFALGLAGSFWPAAAAELRPDAGTLLQQARPIAPAPAPSAAETGLRFEIPASGALPPSAAFEVQSFKITGNTLFPAPTLLALLEDARGRALTLPELGQLAARITEFHNRRGYPLVRAIVPPQVIRAGEVELRVIEGRYGRVLLDNSSAIRQGVLLSTLNRLQPGQVVSQPALDEALLLFNDMPGVSSVATLQPGQEPGLSDLLVSITPGPRFSGQVGIENYGGASTGRNRANASLNVPNPLAFGDLLSLNLISPGGNMLYGRAAYELLLDGAGTRAGASLSSVQYSLGGALAALGAQGTAHVAGLNVRRPLLRGRLLNVYASAQVEHKRLVDRVDTGNLRTDRKIDLFQLGLSADRRDDWAGGGVFTGSLTLSGGRVGFLSPEAEQVDAATAGTRGNFSKINLGIARVQSLGEATSLTISLAGQWTNRNLDSAEKMSLGGASSVRAYDVSVVSGDSAVVGTFELRRSLGALPMGIPGKWQVGVFLDAASVTVNSKPWTTSVNSLELLGTGVGLEWAGRQQLTARLQVGHRLGEPPAGLKNPARTRAWAELGWKF